jgi:MerR family transcriptional regulator, thiopeptide resistance regulator
MTEGAALTVGQVAERFGVTVRTLHHYDEIGLVRPHRTVSGYRIYTDDDLERLRHVVVYRRLGFPLEESGRCSTTRTRTSRLIYAGSGRRS